MINIVMVNGFPRSGKTLFTNNLMNNILRLFCLFGLLPFPTFVIKNFGKRIRGLE